MLTKGNLFMKYCKRPVVVEAQQFLTGKPLPFSDKGPVVAFDEGIWYVETIQGKMVPLSEGDWIILEQGGKSHQAYPCAKEVFERTYDPVEDDDCEEVEDEGEMCPQCMAPGEITHSVSLPPPNFDRLVGRLVHLKGEHDGEIDGEVLSAVLGIRRVDNVEMTIVSCVVQLEDGCIVQTELDHTDLLIVGKK